jgi:molybdopterin-guanine dinucleotide biosynthesis protein A
MNPLGVILAGGEASRMGRDKALAKVAGQSMVEWVAGALRSVTPDVVVLGRSGTLAGLECFPDDRAARRGPMAGLATALRLGMGRPALLVAVDQPWLRVETLTALVELAGPLHAVVPIAGGARQVTCAVYPGSWEERAAAEDADDGSIQSLLDSLLFHPIEESEWQSWGEDGRSWFSVDTDEDLAEGLGRYGPPGA